MSERVQQVREAVVAILDTHASVVALTGRASGNVVPWDDLGDGHVPAIAYQFVADDFGPIENSRAIQMQFTAVASSETAANELIALVMTLLTWSAFNALATPLDAYVENVVREGVPRDTDLPAGMSERCRADANITIVA